VWVRGTIMATLKELTKRPKVLTGGHRLCAGCGASIGVRQVLLGTEDPVVVGCATGCLEVTTTIYPYTAWKSPFIHNAFENVAATISGVETAYRALKKKGKIKKEIKFVAFGGDGGTYDIGLQSLSGALERGHKMVYVCYNNEAYMNCLSLSTLIATKDGLKRITEIKVGEQVYAFDMKTHRLVLKRCSGVFDNGVHDAYELSTLHHSIKATSNHPFLVLKRNGRGRENELVWKELKDISSGDEIVVSKQLVPGKSKRFDYNKVKKGDYKVNRINNYLRTNEEYVYINSVNLAEFINSLSFGQGSSAERVHSSVLTLPQEENYPVQNFLIGNEYFAMERVKEIKLVGKEATLDLRIEDEHNFIANGIVVHNTGIQRSGATPCGASTTTAPAGKVKPGKEQFRKDLTSIVAAHHIPYVAQASISHWKDLVNKAEKAFKADGPAFINMLVPCHRGWRYPMEKTVEISKLAVDTGFWPLFEVENGVWRITIRPKERKPIIEWIKSQGRFSHLLKEENKEFLERVQKEVDDYWKYLEGMCRATQPQ
jgi:pyruvate/2-oxoacid:ferredoxin oxidoreductase beta subunit